MLAVWVVSSACAGGTRPAASPAAGSAGSLAQIYFWRARPGKLAEYNRYIQEVAEPIDRSAQERGAFLSVTTYVSQDTSTAWTHMRVFILRDSTQLAGLSGALERAGIEVEPDSAKRRVRGEYATTLRERFGALTVKVLP
jgi:hypothetical protein